MLVHKWRLTFDNMRSLAFISTSLKRVFVFGDFFFLNTFAKGSRRSTACSCWLSRENVIIFYACRIWNSFTSPNRPDRVLNALSRTWVSRLEMSEVIIPPSVLRPAPLSQRHFITDCRLVPTKPTNLFVSKTLDRSEQLTGSQTAPLSSLTLKTYYKVSCFLPT